MKIIVASLLSLILVIAPHYAYANIGGWTVSKIGMVGKTAFTEAISGNKKSIVKLSPTVGMVGKVLKTANGLAMLHTAVTAMLGATDWVMDPANNAIIYKEKPQGIEFIFYGKVFAKAEDACQYASTPAFLSKRGLEFTRLGSSYSDRGKTKISTSIHSDNFGFTCSISLASHNDIEYYSPTPIGYMYDFGGSIVKEIKKYYKST